MKLLLDNFSGHNIDLDQAIKNVQVEFLAPNTTSVLQPLDAGIINAFKAKYRSSLSNLMIEYLDQSKEIKLSSVRTGQEKYKT